MGPVTSADGEFGQKTGSRMSGLGLEAGYPLEDGRVDLKASPGWWEVEQVGVEDRACIQGSLTPRLLLASHRSLGSGPFCKAHLQGQPTVSSLPSWCPAGLGVTRGQ
jgi:hypothetical protein